MCREQPHALFSSRSSPGSTWGREPLRAVGQPCSEGLPSAKLQQLLQPMLPSADESKLHGIVSELRCALKEADLTARSYAKQAHPQGVRRISHEANSVLSLPALHCMRAALLQHLGRSCSPCYTVKDILYPRKVYCSEKNCLCFTRLSSQAEFCVVSYAAALQAYDVLPSSNAYSGTDCSKCTSQPADLQSLRLELEASKAAAAEERQRLSLEASQSRQLSRAREAQVSSSTLPEDFSRT